MPLRRAVLLSSMSLLLSSMMCPLVSAPGAQAQTPPQPESPPAATASPSSTPPVADATVDTPGSLVRATASIFARFELRRDFQALGLPPTRLTADQDAFYYRTRLGLILDAIEFADVYAVSARFVPQASGVWHVGGDGLEDVDLDLHEGLIELHGPWFRLDAGRFEMVYGEHLVIGNVDWHQTGRSFDGLRLHLSPGPDAFYVDTFFTVLDEGLVRGITQTDDVTAGDQYFTGLYAGLGPLLARGLALDAYLLGRVWVGGEDPVAMTTTDTRGHATLGARSKARFGVFDYRVEAGVQVGSAAEDVDILAWQGDLELGLSLLDGDMLRVALEGFFASGDDPDTDDTVEGWDQLFPTAHKWLGFADIIGPRTNVAGGVLHLALKALPNLKLGLDAHLFARPEDRRLVDPVDPTLTTTLDGGLVGTEVDLGALWAIGGGLKLRTNYSLFVPLEDAWASDDPAHFYEFELRFDH